MNNGPIYNRFAEEFEVWLDGEFVTWASDIPTAEKLYNQALHQKCEHMKHSQNAWEWHTLTTPDEDVVKTLDTIISQKLCAWCGKVLGTVETSKPSHGICEACKEVELAKNLVFLTILTFYILTHN